MKTNKHRIFKKIYCPKNFEKKIKINSLVKNTFKQQILDFLFPIKSVKVFKSIRCLSLLAILLSIRIILTFFSISIPVINCHISISWVPNIFFGWFFGPIYGFCFGWLTDTTCYFLFSKSFWYWMYAIQEPLIGLMSGLFSGFLSLITKYKNNSVISQTKNIFSQRYIQGIIITIFIAIMCLLFHYWVLPDINSSSRIRLIKYLVFFSLFVFFIIYECIYLVFVRKKASNLIIIIGIFELFSIVIFSFLIAPFAFINYYSIFYNGQIPNIIAKYGFSLFILARCPIEAIKAIIMIPLLYSLINIFDQHIDKIKRSFNYGWQ